MSLLNLNFQCNCAADSKQGGRSENQDCVGAFDTVYGSLLLVCDGMGGGPGGKTASTLAVQAIKYAISELSHEDKTRPEILKDAILYANQVLLNKQADNPDLRGMGTTCTALLIDNNSAVIAHVGDSRVYRIRDKHKSFRTRDHSKVGEMVRRGLLTEEQARLSAESNIITRALGRANLAEPEVEEVGFEKGDRFVLCTDGIWGMMPEPELIKKCSENKNIDALVESVIIYVDTKGFSQGGQHDNLSLAILEPHIDSKYKEPMNKKAKRILYLLGAVCVLSVLFNVFQHLRLSRLDTAKETIAALNESKNNLAVEKNALSDTIAKASAEAEAARNETEALKREKESKIKDLNDEIERLKKELDNLKAENEKLRNQITTSNQHKLVTSVSQTVSEKSPLAVIKVKLEALKKCTGDTESECAQKVDKQNRIIKEYINQNIKKLSNNNDKTKLQQIKDELNQPWDKSVHRCDDKKFRLTKVAQNRIDDIIKKL